MQAPSPAVRAVGIAAVVTVVLALLITWFSWPAKALEPRDLPVVVAGPAPAAATIADRLAAERPGAFAVTTVADANAADAALRAGEAYAAFVLGPNGMALHTASGASPTVAALITQAVQTLGGGQPVQVVDVVPGSPDDPRGAGFASGFLPLVLASMVAGVIFAVALTSRAARLIGLGTFALLAGFVGAAVLHGLGVLAGSYLATSLAIALTALAVSATITGLAAALGIGGIGLGVLLVFLFGNPISAVAAAPELLPQPWGTVGQLLPVGAGGSLLRSAAFLGGAGSAAPLWTLVVWAAVGLTLVVLGRARVGLHSPASRAASEPAGVTSA